MHSWIGWVNQMDVYLVSFCVLLIIQMSILKKENRTFEDKIIFSLAFVTAVLMSFDTVGWIIDGKPGRGLIVFNNALNVFLQSAVSLPAYLWALYASNVSFRDKRIVRRLAVAGAVPLVAAALMVASSPFTGLTFTIDAGNTYHRGPLFPVLYVISIIYMVYSSVITAVYWKEIDRAILKPVFFFPLPPIIGGGLQSFAYGLKLTYPGIALSVVIIYVLVQQLRLATDYLTGVGNRLSLDDFLAECFSDGLQGRPFSALMIDVDDFKRINDTFGHHAGDTALRELADLLNGSVRRNDFIARYAGDEFVVVIKNDDGQILDKAVERIERAVEKLNAGPGRPFAVGISIGCGVCEPGRWRNQDEFIGEIDRRMYEAKQLKKENRKD